MSIIRNWKEYFSLEESKKMTEDYIKQSAEEMIIELRKRRAKNFKSWTEVIFSNNEELCMK